MRFLVFLLLVGCATPRSEFFCDDTPHLDPASCGLPVECGRPYTDAEDLAGVEHDCAYYGEPR